MNFITWANNKKWHEVGEVPRPLFIAVHVPSDGARVAEQVYSVFNHDLPERVAMLSLAVFSFEEPAIAFHLKKDEAGLGVTTLQSRELLLISKHDLPTSEGSSS